MHYFLVEFPGGITTVEKGGSPRVALNRAMARVMGKNLKITYPDSKNDLQILPGSVWDIRIREITINQYRDMGGK